ncbi:hypothetical protein OH492_06190 [Vibrio chagasii]|nr:hypothetical protein [Vibrio chagasii]
MLLFVLSSYTHSPYEDVRAAIAQYTNVVDYVCVKKSLRTKVLGTAANITRAAIPVGADIQYAGRPASASPAVGYMSAHLKQQKALVDDA